MRNVRASRAAVSAAALSVRDSFLPVRSTRVGKFLSVSAIVIALGGVASARAQSMSVDSLDGPVTTNEINSFVSYIQTINPVVWPNTGSMENQYAQGTSGEQIKAMGLMFEISGNTTILNRMIYFCDTLLSQRNDLLASPNGQRVYWNGKVSPAWPGQALGTTPVYSTSASGDCVGHLANCAQLILRTPSIWNTTVPDGNPFGYGATYLDRAKTYVAQSDYTFNNCFFPDMLTLTNSGLTNIYCYPAGYPYQPGNQYPWNQAMMMSYPLQYMAIAHQLLGDNPALVTKYDNLVQTNVTRIFTDTTTRIVYTDSAGNTAYNWSYNPSANSGEDSNHGSLDVAGFYRAFVTNRYGITASQMTPFANMIVDVFTGTIGSYYHGRVDGTDGTGHAASTTYLRSGYFFTAEFRPTEYYHMVQGLHITAPGTTTSMDAFSRLMWIKNRRYVGTGSNNLALNKPASASSIWSATYAASKAVDGSVTSSRWSAASGQINNQWLLVDFGVATNFDNVVIKEISFPRTTAFKIQSSTDGTTFTDRATGTTIGANKAVSFSAVSARYIRLFITTASAEPTIDEFEVYSSGGGGGTVAAPSFSPAGGTYTSAQSVTISSTTSGASIRYTLDGSTPTSTTGTVYSGAVTIGSTATLKAIAYKSGMTDSSVTSATYTINLPPPVNLALNKTASASTTWSTSYTAAMAVDGSTSTRWSAASGQTTNQWLLVDLGGTHTFSNVVIKEISFQRVTAFKIQSSTDGTTFTDRATGTTIGSNKSVSFTAVSARYVRLYVTTASDVPTIDEFEVWGN
jgi:hypothetical protein